MLDLKSQPLPIRKDSQGPFGGFSFCKATRAQCFVLLLDVLGELSDDLVGAAVAQPRAG